MGPNSASPPPHNNPSELGSAKVWEVSDLDAVAIVKPVLEVEPAPEKSKARHATNGISLKFEGNIMEGGIRKIGTMAIYEGPPSSGKLPNHPDLPNLLGWS